MTINSITGKPLKHYATDKTTHARYVMLALENETDANTCSVIDIDSLTSEMRSELAEIIDSDECQSVIDPWVVLTKKFFMDYPKQPILTVLRSLRKIKVLDSDQVLVQLPNNQTMTPKEIADNIRAYKNKSNKPMATLPAEDKKMIDSFKEKENQNAKEIEDLKQQVSSLTTSIAELVSLMKQPAGKKTKK